MPPRIRATAEDTCRRGPRRTRARGEQCKRTRPEEVPMRRILVASSLAATVLAAGWVAGVQTASAQGGCYVQPGASGGSCHYKADGSGPSGYSVWTQGAWKITQKAKKKT